MSYNITSLTSGLLVLVFAFFTADSGRATPYSSDSYGSLGSYAVSGIPVGAEPKAVVTGDFNSDNQVDLAVANRSSGNVSILLGDGTGRFAAAQNFPAGAEPFSIAVDDFIAACNWMLPGNRNG